MVSASSINRMRKSPTFSRSSSVSPRSFFTLPAPVSANRWSAVKIRMAVGISSLRTSARAWSEKPIFFAPPSLLRFGGIFHVLAFQVLQSQPEIGQHIFERNRLVVLQPFGGLGDRLTFF